MRRVHYYAVLENMDKTEGRGPMRETGIGFDHHADAITFVTSDKYSSISIRDRGSQTTTRKEIIK